MRCPKCDGILSRVKTRHVLTEELEIWLKCSCGWKTDEMMKDDLV